MAVDQGNKIKIREFLKVNIATLQGADLDQFLEKYGIREATGIEMMILDMGVPDGFLAFANPKKKGSFLVATIDIVDKILVLEPEAIS